MNSMIRLIRSRYDPSVSARTHEKGVALLYKFILFKKYRQGV